MTARFGTSLLLLPALAFSAPAIAQTGSIGATVPDGVIGPHGETGCNFTAIPGLNLNPYSASYVSKADQQSSYGQTYLVAFTPHEDRAWTARTVALRILISDPLLENRPIDRVRLVADGREIHAAFAIAQPAQATAAYVELTPAAAARTHLFAAIAGASRIGIDLLDRDGAVAVHRDFAVAALRDVPRALAAAGWACGA
jgi:hypothetical protein